MRKHLFFLLAAVLVCMPLAAQKKYSVYAVGFYNQENLFDYTHDEGKNDYEFTPGGSYKWNEMKYTHKLHNMSRVLSEMGTDVLPNVGCAVIGLSEVENAHVMEDLVAQPSLSGRGYKYIHIEGPDHRGVDCALLYNPQLFTVFDSKLVPYVYDLPKDSARATRGFLTVSGTLAGEHVTFIVCHLPSRGAGSYYRESGGRQVKALKDSLLADDPQVKVIVMGDMNDDPTDKSMHECLSAKGEISKVGAGDMYSPWYNMLVKEGTGTLQYQGKWNLFDQIILSPGLLNLNGQKDFSSLKYWKSQIFRRDYLFQEAGKHKGNTKRTTAGGVWLDGYSDHLPVVTYLVKEQ
ncbi:endonuclease/exonuclease/phosphatase family protein [Prevotella dentasini]|uniref:endonuclease/exonuclease/phosphatase family protein n=1 Tax=Prevotella dentasini TaxID=589537 RepID=UPI0004680D13|nr:endonuclease/exonuclease/phosphatase family protein [Prevotella dentasini]